VLRGGGGGGRSAGHNQGWMCVYLAMHTDSFHLSDAIGLIMHVVVLHANHVQGHGHGHARHGLAQTVGMLV
jgi:hypothetical protein